MLKLKSSLDQNGKYPSIITITCDSHGFMHLFLEAGLSVLLRNCPVHLWISQFTQRRFCLASKWPLCK